MIQSGYRCPECGKSPRKEDKSYREGEKLIRKITYGCGTVMKLENSGLNWTSEIKPAMKCLNGTKSS